MDWKKINDECPKAFLEWVNNRGCIKSNCVNLEWVRDIKGASHFRDFNWNARRVDDRDIWQLPEYFDALQISINPLVVNEHNTCCFVNNEWIKDENGKARTDFLSRRAALEEGVKEAFRIREQQLNK